MYGFYQSKNKFDKYEGEELWTYVLIDDDGSTLIARMPDRPEYAIDEIRMESERWVGRVGLVDNMQMIPFHPVNDPSDVVTLKIKVSEDVVFIVDPNQDEWGGMSGSYKAISWED